MNNEQLDYLIETIDRWNNDAKIAGAYTPILNLIKEIIEEG